MNNANRPAPPSSEHEVFHSGELTGKILPEGSLYFDGYLGRWVKSIYVGEKPVPWSWYAIPAWRMIDKCDDVLTEGWQFRMRGEEKWFNGSSLAVGGNPVNLEGAEYRVPALPTETKAEQGVGATAKHTLWVKTSERQPPFGVPVHWRRIGVRCMDLGSADTRNENSVWDSDIEWLDLDAAEAIEAERDKLAEENEKLRADNKFLDEAIDAAIKDRDHFEAEADRLRNEVARLQSYSDYQGKEVKRLRDELATSDSRRARACIAEIEREIAPRKSDSSTDTFNDHCVNCQLFDGCYLAAGGNGACRRYPEPRGVGNPEAHWCGEFKKKPEISTSEYYDTSQDAQR